MVNNTWHLTLAKIGTFKPSRKVVIWSVSGVLVAAILGTAGWQLWQNNQYHQSVTKYASDVTDLLQGGKKNIEGWLVGTDTSKTATAMTDLATSLENKHIPAEPRLFGWQIGTNTDYSTQTSIATAIKKYAVGLRDAAAFITYQNSIMGAMQPLAAMTSVSGVDQINALLGAYTAALEGIKKISAPNTAKDAHVILVAKMSEAVAALGKMPDLYKKVDTAGFEAAKKDFSTAMGGVSALSVQAGEIAKSYDDILNADRGKF